MAAMLRTTPDPATTPVGDTITLVVWAVLAACALRLVRRLPRRERGAWLVVAIYCTIVAVDKAVDLQTVFYRVVQWALDVADPWLGVRAHRNLVKGLLLVPLTIVAVGGTLWLVRRDRHLDRGRKLAIAGLVLVLLLVGLRLLPPFRALDETACWVVEGLACGLIAWGLRLGWRTLPGAAARTPGP